mmetsp:Transcript_20557/g.35062  ORF Transcript_20557/g.35062 Transcript_20557/m.35062 type:complete len:139 (-) Transcript_20557:571-987(-)
MSTNNADDSDDNDDSPEAVVLDPKKPLEMVRAVQSLLKRSSSDGDDTCISDHVLAEMERQGVRVNQLARYGLVSLDDITADYVLDTPFFYVRCPSVGRERRRSNDRRCLKNSEGSFDRLFWLQRTVRRLEYPRYRHSW